MVIPLSNGCLASELALWVYAALKGYSCSISNKNEKIQKEMEYICFLSCLSIYLFLIFTGKLGALFPCHTLSGFFRG